MQIHPMEKKRKSRRISSRKKHNIAKKVKSRAKKQSKLKKKEMMGKTRLPKNVLLTDEDLEQLKTIKLEEKMRASEFKNRPVQEEKLVSETFKRMVEQNDVVLEVLDCRDPMGSRNSLEEEFIKERGKDLVLVLNYKEDVPTEKVEEWGRYFEGCGETVVGISKDEDSLTNLCRVVQEKIKDSKIDSNKDSNKDSSKDSKIDSIKDSKIDSSKDSNKDSRVGIFGQKGVGKMYLYKLLSDRLHTGETTLLDRNLIRTECSQFDILSLLRHSIPLESVFYRRLFKDFLEEIDRDQFCLYFGIPFFESFGDLEDSFIKKFKITSLRPTHRVIEIILDEFYNGNIKFWRESPETKRICLKYA